MTPLRKYQLALALFVASSFPIIFLSLYVHEAFLGLLLANTLFWSWRAKAVCCARCANPIAPPAGASALEILNSLRLEKCRNCGARLDGTDID
jgi:hypothetical protein